MHRRIALSTLLLAVAAAAAGLLSLTGGDAGAATGFDVQTTYTISGSLVEGGSATLTLTATNVGTETYPYDVVVAQYLPDGIKRDGVPAGILCEAYRGHRGGSATYKDYCHGTLPGPIPAGGSVRFALPVRLLAAGDHLPLGETASGVPFRDPCCSGVFYPNIVPIELPVHVDPAPVAGGGGGGGGGGGATTTLPDLQVTGRISSTGSLLAADGATAASSWVVQNNGKVGATSVLFTLPMPSGIAALAATTTLGSCDVTAASVVCALDRVDPGVKVTVTVSEARAPAIPQTYTHIGTANSADGDAKASNNTATVSFATK